MEAYAYAFAFTRIPPVVDPDQAEQPHKHVGGGNAYYRQV